MEIYAMKFSAFCLSILFMVTSYNIYAVDKNGKFAIKGVGNTSCEEFVAHTRNDRYQKFLYAGWINGYITAQNQHLKDNFDITSWENIETIGNYLVSHCEKHPKLSFFQAVTLLINEIYEDRIPEFKGANSIEKGADGGQIYAQTVARVQNSLKEKGLYDGKVNGKIDEVLISAVKAYKKEQGLVENGDLDQQVLFKLFRSEN
jgi:hypothetical protein